MGHSPWGHKESDMTEQLHFTSQIIEERRKAKGKGGKERHTHVNAEFQRIARRDKEVFLSGQCKEL